MKKACFHSLVGLTLWALPLLLLAQGNPSRGIPYIPATVSFNHLSGAFLSKHDGAIISASPDLAVDVVVEFAVYTKAKGASGWALKESGTIQEPGYELQRCYPGTKRVMIILSCKQEGGGAVKFSSNHCKK